MTDLRIESHDESYPPSVWSASTFGSIAPTTAVVNVPTAYVLTGSNFEPGSIVKVNGTDVPSTFVSPTRINVTYSGTSAGSVNFTVTTNGKTTSPKPVVITATQAEPAAAPTLQPEAPTGEPQDFGAPVPVDELPGA